MHTQRTASRRESKTKVLDRKIHKTEQDKARGDAPRFPGMRDQERLDHFVQRNWVARVTFDLARL